MDYQHTSRYIVSTRMRSSVYYFAFPHYLGLACFCKNAATKIPEVLLSIFEGRSQHVIAFECLRKLAEHPLGAARRGTNLRGVTSSGRDTVPMFSLGMGNRHGHVFTDK